LKLLHLFGQLYQREEEETMVDVSKEKEEIPETSPDDTGLVSRLS